MYSEISKYSIQGCINLVIAHTTAHYKEQRVEFTFHIYKQVHLQIKGKMS